MLIGAPGSGKTKHAEQMYDGLSIVSSDAIREWVFDDVTNQHPAIWRVIRAVARAKIEARIVDTVVLDATFAKRRDRVAMLNDIRSWIQPGDTVEGIYFSPPKSEIHERNARRDRVVPKHAVDGMLSALGAHPPHVDDGFDSLRVIT